jgi:hypothetical protein
MTQVFERVCNVVVADTEVTGLRTTFKVEADLTRNVNNSEIEIYNLSESTRGRVQKKGALVRLEAGYTNNKSIIFFGNTRIVDHVREKADWRTKIRLGDGEEFYLFSKGTFSFKPGTTTINVINSLASKATGLRGLGNINELISNLPANMASFPSGFSSHGSIPNALGEIAATAGYRMSVQNGVLKFVKQQVSAIELTSSIKDAILLSPDTGLIGSPEHGSADKQSKTKPLLKIRALLDPRLRCGSPIRIEASQVQGSFFIEKLKHYGDTHGGDWYTELEVKPL